MNRGGHTGNALLTTDLSDSELYLRITSTSDGYRMPKQGEPLAAKDVGKVARWIQQVSAQQISAQQISTQKVTDSFASTAATDGVTIVAATSAYESETSNAELVLGMQPMQLAMLAASLITILVLVAWLTSRFVRKQLAGRSFSQSSLRSGSAFALLIGLGSGILVVFTGYLYWRTEVLTNENVALRAKVRTASVTMPPVIEVNESNLPLPPYPMHPPRLGGQYYRGNDERNDDLFNGGFYRTATIDLHLVNSNGDELNWGDRPSEDVAVEIAISRAPNATRELFSHRVLDSLSVEHFCQTNPELNRKFKLDIVEKEEVWKVKVPLPKTDKWQEQKSEGMIYLMYGKQPGQEQLPRPHFAVRYDLELAKGAVSEASVLWMGSMYTLGGRVLVPDEKKILLDRWFDWRPIPVIEGKAATDSKLLGTEEHLGKSR